MTEEQIGALMSDEELKRIGMTREEWIANFLEEQEHTNVWARRAVEEI